jgi:hypothetical protein
VDSRRFTVSQAAKHLSTTESSIRHKVNRNSIPHEKDEETNRVYILIDQVEDEELTEDNQRTTNGDPPDTERLIDALTAQLEQAQESLRHEREANRENRRLLAAALERIPAIEAPDGQDGDLTATDGSPNSSGREGERAKPRRGWWARVFLGPEREES